MDKEFESSYACFAGNPVLFADPNGDDAAGAIVGAVVGASAGVATGYLVTKNAPNSRDFAMITMGVWGGLTGALAGSYHDIGPDITKAAKAVANFVVENQDVWLAGYLNYRTNRYKDQPFLTSVAYFAIGAGGRAFTKYMPTYLEKVTGGNLGISKDLGKALFNLAGMGIAASGNIIAYQLSSDKDSYEEHGRKMWQFALAGAVSVYSGGMLHKKMSSSNPGKSYELKDKLKKGLEYGLLNYATTLSTSGQYMGDREGYLWPHIAAFTVGFANGYVQAQLNESFKDYSYFGRVWRLAGIYSAETILTSIVLYSNQGNLKKVLTYTGESYVYKGQVILVKSLLFAQ